jgi:hypothetical protein
LAAFHPEVPVSHESLLFFDTETTGLGIGAGNVAFMLGLGYYATDEFVVEQLFIRNPAEEIAMLAYFHELSSRFSHLVSYNGRTFDWPIIQNLYIMNRLDFAPHRPLHLDFLYPSRSLWRHTMPSCRLGKVEEQQLRFFRLEDVPGSLAPALYFQYLAEGDPEVVRGVFVHNEMDILSLAGLAIHFGGALGGNLSPLFMEAEEVFRLGLWLDRMGKGELAEEAFAHLLHRSSDECASYWIPLAAHYKKKKDEAKAVRLWNLAAERLAEDRRGLASPEPFIELAMYHEHKKKDFSAALRFAEEAHRQLIKRSSFIRPTAKQRGEQEELKKRIKRLKGKLEAENRRLAGKVSSRKAGDWRLGEETSSRQAGDWRLGGEMSSQQAGDSQQASEADIRDLKAHTAVPSPSASRQRKNGTRRNPDLSTDYAGTLF